MATRGSQHDMARADNTLHGHVAYPGDDATPEELARWTASRWSSQDSLYEPFMRTWAESIAFLRGRHWDKWHTGARAMLPEADVPPWRQRLVSNYTFAIFKTFVAKLTKNRPAWDVRPRSGDMQDVNAALLGRSILEWLWAHELKLGEYWRRLVGWVVATGNAWAEVYWNTETGNMVQLTVPVQVPERDEFGNPTGNYMEAEAAADPETGEPILDPFGMPAQVQPQEVDMGQVGVVLHPPFSVRTNPEGFSDPDAVTDVMVGIEVSREWFLRRFGEEKAKEVQWGGESTVQGMARSLEAMSTGGHQDARFQTFTATTLESRGDSCFLIRHYHKPDSDFPEGRFWVAASNGVMVEDEQPLPLGIWPLVHVSAYPNPGLLLSSSPLEPVIPLNRRLNEQNSKIAEHEALMVQGKWLVPKTANLRKGAITTQPGEVIEYTPPFEPKMADIRALPNAIYAEREVTKSDMQFVSGMHKISLGQPPPGVTAGKAFLVLQEADDTDLGPILAALSDALAEIGYIVLWTVRRFYDESRVVAVSGMEAGEWLYRDFVGDDLDPSGKGGLSLSVKVQEGSMFPWLKAAAQEVALQLMQTPVGQALLLDVNTGVVDKSRLANVLQVGGLENLVDATDLDRSEAERTYDDLARWRPGDPVPQPMEWQDIGVHVEIFERHLKSASFGALDRINQQIVLNYYRQLRLILQQQAELAAQQAMQQMAEAKQAEAYAQKSGELQAESEVMEIEMPGSPDRAAGGRNTRGQREARGERT